MDRAVKPRRTKYKFSLLGSDWIEWLIVAMLCATAALGVALLTGSVVSAVIVGLVLLAAASAVVALL
ncbi:hypothetical protein [Antrihabitans sp. YC2-6]|uniref:hypothetical protein n=1 Tax=Antrihabitans sp. YC2-6 TaxID=2799498 RepID=UPI0018F6634D|nr:hypothetical protein [Antrihabitans sp. YC2-6]MBJ8346555.1 hypothetical protein [Antrihabitans sp. YC2-6]